MGTFTDLHFFRGCDWLVIYSEHMYPGPLLLEGIQYYWNVKIFCKGFMTHYQNPIFGKTYLLLGLAHLKPLLHYFINSEQPYDNASNLFGRFAGVQARIKGMNKCAPCAHVLFIPEKAHEIGHGGGRGLRIRFSDIGGVTMVGSDAK